MHVLDLSELDNISVESLDADAEDILRAYSLWLRDTNIPKNHAKARDKNVTPSPPCMVYSGLKEYIDKTINVMKEILPANAFLMDDEEIALISGKNFEKGCKRSQMSKSDVFGVESKVGLYRVARHPTIPGYAPHWTALVNCDTICKNMMYRTKNDDVYNDLMGKRAALVINKHAVGRGGEFGQLNVKKFTFNPFLDCVDTLWKEMKTLTLHACPFVANKEGFATDVYHALGCYFACGNGLYRSGDSQDNSYLFPRAMKYSGSGASRWLTDAIRNNLNDEVPLDSKFSVSAVSLRIAGITEMAAGGIDYYHSHARSGHHIDSNQQRYVDGQDPVSSITAAKCLAGWSDFYSQVSYFSFIIFCFCYLHFISAADCFRCTLQIFVAWVLLKK